MKKKQDIVGKRKGFTLIELLIVLAIGTVLTTGGFLVFSRVMDSQNLDLTTNEIIATMREVQRRSVTQQSGKQWGIRFSNTTSGVSAYTIWSGSSYASGTIDQIRGLRRNIVFGNPPSETDFDIIFSALSGAVSNNQIISFHGGGNPSLVHNIVVNTLGKSAEQVENGLIGYWHFDKGTSTVAYDATGHGIHGALQGSPTWTSASGCKSGECLTFNGSNNYVVSSSSLNISGDADFTMCAWIKWTDGSWSTNYPSFMGNNSTGVTGEGLSFTVKDGRPAVDFWNNRFRATNALDVNTWYHVCGTKASGNISTNTILYVNGAPVSGSIEGSDSTPDITESFAVAGRLDATRWFKGIIDEVRFYNRVLSATEIEKIYNDLR